MYVSMRFQEKNKRLSFFFIMLGMGYNIYGQKILPSYILDYFIIHFYIYFLESEPKNVTNVTDSLQKLSLAIENHYSILYFLESEPKNDTNVTDSLQNLSLAIEKRRKSESLIANGKNCENEDKIHEQMEQLDQLVESFIKDHDRNNDQNDQNDKNQINIDDSMNKSILNGETMEEMRAKFMKHQQIYKTNYELAETEIKRMDELYQDLIENVLKVRKTNQYTRTIVKVPSGGKYLVRGQRDFDRNLKRTPKKPTEKKLQNFYILSILASMISMSFRGLSFSDLASICAL